MNFSLRLALTPSAEQHARLLALQAAFAQVCNELSPIVQQTRVWNRVALHHMAYKGLRERFPALGSQMVCNAIYSVSRASRLIFQTPGSPFHVSRLAGRPLPLLRFADTCPVYFDRHTLSLKQGQVSMFTLDGRMKFQLALSPQQETVFHTHKLQEIVLQRVGAPFELALQFGPPGAAAVAVAVAADATGSAQPAQPAALQPPQDSVSLAPTLPTPGLQPDNEDPGLARSNAFLLPPTPGLIVPEYLKIEEPA